MRALAVLRAVDQYTPCRVCRSQHEHAPDCALAALIGAKVQEK